MRMRMRTLMTRKMTPEPRSLKGSRQPRRVGSLAWWAGGEGAGPRFRMWKMRMMGHGWGAGDPRKTLGQGSRGSGRKTRTRLWSWNKENPQG